MTATGYTRQSSATIVTSNTIQASDFNNEYNLLQSAFDGTIGHDHSGGVGLGPKISLVNAVTGILPGANGGTNSAYVQFTGGTALRTYTVPDASCTLLTTNAVVTVAQGGTGLATLTSGAVMLGNGTSNVAFVTAGSSGNILMDNGTAWASSAQTAITKLGTITSGAWQGSVIASTYGGTGVNNSNTITLGGNITTAGAFTTSGAFALTLTTTGITNVTLPTSGTLVNTAVTALTSLASIGTITSGVWNGTTIAVANGGTGQTSASAAFNALSPMTTSGDIIYGGASGAGTRLGANATGTNKYLQSVSSGTPTWAQVAFSDLSGTASSGQLSGSYTGITAVGTLTSGTWNATKIGALYGGTNIDSSVSTGIAQVSSGTWSVATSLPSGTTATTQSAGDNSTKVATTAYVDGQAIFTKQYSSGTQTYSSGGTLTLAHSLGTTPKIIQCYMTCTTGEHGYSVNDVLYVPAGFIDLNNGNGGMAVTFDSTNIYVKFGTGTSGAGIGATDKSAGTGVRLSFANWSIAFRAYA